MLADFAYPLPVGVICELLGVPAADRPLFRRWAGDLTGVLEPEITPEELAVADAGATELRDYFVELVVAPAAGTGRRPDHRAGPGARR